MTPRWPLMTSLPRSITTLPINVAMPPQQMITNPANGQFPGVPPQLPPQLQQQLQQGQGQQQLQQPGMSPVPGPLTAPRPGALPQQPSVPGAVPNPYQPVPLRPGGGGPGGPDEQ